MQYSRTFFRRAGGVIEDDHIDDETPLVFKLTELAQI